MDDEDIQELTGGSQIRARDEFDILGGTANELKKRRLLSEQVSKESTTLSSVTSSVIDNIIAPVKDTIGAKLMRMLGWKEGQGIGPKMKKTDQGGLPNITFSFVSQSCNSNPTEFIHD